MLMLFMTSIRMFGGVALTTALRTNPANPLMRKRAACKAAGPWPAVVAAVQLSPSLRGQLFSGSARTRVAASGFQLLGAAYPGKE